MLYFLFQGVCDMRFIVDAKEFSDALNLAIHTTDKKNPISSCVKLEAKKKSLRILSTTGFAGSSLSIKAVVADDGEAIVPADALLKSVRQCEHDTKMAVKDNNMVITNGCKEYKVLMLAKPESFPFSEKKDFGTYTVCLHDIVASMRMILPASDTIRETEFKGVGIEACKEGMRISALSITSGAGYMATVKAKSDKDAQPVIVAPEFATLVISLMSPEKYDLQIGVDKSTVVIKHAKGYTYLPQLTKTPIPAEKYTKFLKLESDPVHAIAGLMAKSVRNCLVMGDKEEGYKGRLQGQKGKILLSSYSNMAGFAKDELIIAGDLTVDHWYNFRVLHGYLSAIVPEDEIRIHTVVKPGDGKFDSSAVLVIRYQDHVFWQVSCGAPEELADVKPKSGKGVS